MKTRILLAVIVALFTLASPTVAHKATITFQLSNDQPEELGSVAIAAPGGDTYLTVSSQGSYSTEIPSNATSITINSQQVEQGVKAYVTLSSHKAVAVLWVSTNTIAVEATEIIQ